MSRRLLILAAALTLASVGCHEVPAATVDYGQGLRFVPAVADANDNVGLGSSIAVDAEGAPFISYFGFPQEAVEGQIVVPRPIGVPNVPGVLLTSLTTDQVFDRGAVVMAEAAPNGVSIAFGPEVPENLDLTETNTNGTATVVGEDGTVHVAYTAADGVWYATTSLGGTTSLEQVYDHVFSVGFAGPVGRPGIALVDGVPVVAYAVDRSTGVEVRVATPGEEGWVEEVVTTVGRCNGCPQPGPTGIVATEDGPVVAFIDPSTDELLLEARPAQVAPGDGSAWEEQRFPAGEGAKGLSLGIADGRPVAARYADGAAKVFAAGQLMEVAPADVAELPETGDAAPTTAVAADAEGTFYVAWQDPAGVHLAAGQPGSLESVATQATENGQAPALAVNAEGSVFLSWYAATGQDLYLGALTENPDILVAAPSPSVVVSVGPVVAPCGEDGEVQLDILALGTAFDPTCLVAPAAEPFVINFDNQDPVASTGPHNVAIYDGPDKATEYFIGDAVDGPAQVEYTVDPIEAGEYFFQCDFHPLTMTGTFVSLEGAGGGGGGNDGGGGGGGNDGGGGG
ncbi:MAG: cupredoxin domain-containing protein [Actinomycetota bacterium]